MTHDAFQKSLAALQKRRPFRSYVVHFTDGESIAVEHPEALRYQGVGTAVYFSKSGEMTLFDEDGVAKITSGRKVVAT
jgi:hypothetical protein